MRDDSTQMGRQLEDNATAGLLKLLTELEQRDPEIAASILQTISPSAEIPTAPDFNCEDQVSTKEIDSENDRTHLVGLSTTGLGAPEELEPAEDATENNGIVDGVISIDQGPELVLEVKIKSNPLTEKELRKYANEIDISNSISNYNILTWGDVFGDIRDVRGKSTSAVSEFLLDEFKEFLELTTLEHTLAAAHWTDDGEIKFNKITLRYQRSMNRKTELVDESPPEYHLEFKSEGYNAISFSPREWKEAVRQLPDDVIDGFLTADFDPIEERSGETLASVGDSEGRRKIIESSPKNDNERLVFQSRTPKPNSWYINRPTFHKSDFRKLFDSSSDSLGPAFTDEVVSALFEAGNLTSIPDKVGTGEYVDANR
jgi:hypothetical protein